MSHIESQLTTQDGHTLYYQVWEAEQPAKAIICLVHGLGEHSGRYAHVAKVFNQNNYHVIAFDLYGHGKSQGKRGDIPSYDVMNDHVSDLVNEANNRYPGLPQILYGHSLGGLIVFYFCLKTNPKFRGVIITSPGLCTTLEEQKAKMTLVNLLGPVFPGLIIPSGLNPQMISRDPYIVESYINDPLVHDKASLGFAKNSLDIIHYIFDHADEWSLPLLLMHGTEDKLSYSRCSEKIASLMKQGVCTLRLWPGLTHEIHNEPEKDEVFEFLIKYLDQIV